MKYIEETETTYDFTLEYRRKECPYGLNDEILSGVTDDVPATHQFPGLAFVVLVRNICRRNEIPLHIVYVRQILPPHPCDADVF